MSTEDWATFSDEYVMVENEYEDVGRKILDGQDLKVNLDEKVMSSKKCAGMKTCRNAKIAVDAQCSTGNTSHEGPCVRRRCGRHCC